MFRLRDSFFFKRIMAIFLIALFVWAISTNLLYTFISRPLLVERRSKDLLPQANWIAERSGNYFLDQDEVVENLVSVSYNFFSVWTMIFFSDNRSLETALPDSLGEAAKQEIRDKVYAIHINQMNGLQETNYGTIDISGQDADFLYVLAPIHSYFFSQLSNQPLGTVIMVQPLAEFDLSIRSLNLALLIASLISGILLLIPAFFVTRKLIRPINRIREVALSITDGDFSQEIEVSPYRKDEISDLATAIGEMSQTIYRSMQELSLERNQLQEIIDGISDGIIAVDEAASITQINDVFWSLFQLNKEYFKPDNLLRRLHLDHFFTLCLDEGEIIHEQITLEDSRRIIQCTINPIFDHEGNISAAVGLFRDITKSEHLEQTRRDYIANISHELRSPITAMRALIEPLRDGMVKTEEDRKRYYDIILNETMRLSRLINDMLELSRLQSGTTFVEQGPIDMEVFFSNLAEHISFMSFDKELDFEIDRPQEALPIVWGNEDRIEQIIFTYIDNAAKFTPERNALITLRARLKPKQLILEVEDNGVGIQAEDLPFVFERFYKADKSHNEEGTGLGLSIAKTLADQLNMSVSVRSIPGKGSVFALGIRYAQDVMKKDSHMKEVFDSFESN